MIEKLRPRYYCEHCKKSGGSAHHMRIHEKACTANPDRVCRMCEAGELVQKPIDVLIEAAWLDEQGAGDIDGRKPSQLAAAAEDCPACMLAAIRATSIYFDWDFKEACKVFWDRVNDANAVDVSCGDGE